MKYLPIILLLSLGCINTRPTGETMFKAEMYVRSYYHHMTKCEYKTVLWGFKADTICFFLDRSRCFLNPIEVNKEQNQKDRTIIVTSTEGVRHSIRYIRSNNGFIFFITNLEVGIPNFVLSTHDICYR